MALTTGQMQVLYLLLSTRSQLRAFLEGVFKNNFGTPGDGPIAFGDHASLNARLDIQLALMFPRAGVDHTSLSNVKLLMPRSANDPAQIGGISNDDHRLRTALGIDGIYDPADPCPADFSRVGGPTVRVDQQSKIIAGILSQIP